jgi:tight adherence protein C
MDHWKIVLSVLAFAAVFGVMYVSGLGLVLWMMTDRQRARYRLRNLAGSSPPATERRWSNLVQNTFTRFGKRLVPREGYLAGLRKQLVEAGFYRASDVEMFLGVKLILMIVLPLLAAAVPFMFKSVGLKWAVSISMSAAVAGIMIPNLWLRRQINKRQNALRLALPDALDMLVLCLEGGISMTAAFQRVTDEILDVHPILQNEMKIVQREVQLGLTIGESLKKMGERCGMEQIRDLASVLLQSEQYGTSMVKALRTHADSWRHERQQQMEMLAQQTAVKILFPTLLCIFPAIFIVLLGPAALQMSSLFR